MNIYKRENGQEGEMCGAQECLGDMRCDGSPEEDLDGGEDGDGDEREEEGEEGSLHHTVSIRCNIQGAKSEPKA